MSRFEGELLLELEATTTAVGEEEFAALEDCTAVAVVVAEVAGVGDGLGDGVFVDDGRMESDGGTEAVILLYLQIKFRWNFLYYS